MSVETRRRVQRNWPIVVALALVGAIAAVLALDTLTSSTVRRSPTW